MCLEKHQRNNKITRKLPHRHAKTCNCQGKTSPPKHGHLQPNTYIVKTTKFTIFTAHCSILFFKKCTHKSVGLRIKSGRHRGTSHRNNTCIAIRNSEAYEPKGEILLHRIPQNISTSHFQVSILYTCIKSKMEPFCNNHQFFFSTKTK